MTHQRKPMTPLRWIKKKHCTSMRVWMGGGGSTFPSFMKKPCHKCHYILYTNIYYIYEYIEMYICCRISDLRIAPVTCH